MPPLRQDRPAILLHGYNNGCKNKNPLDGIAKEREKKQTRPKCFRYCALLPIEREHEKVLPAGKVK